MYESHQGDISQTEHTSHYAVIVIHVTLSVGLYSFLHSFRERSWTVYGWTVYGPAVDCVWLDTVCSWLFRDTVTEHCVCLVPCALGLPQTDAQCCTMSHHQCVTSLACLPVCVFLNGSWERYTVRLSCCDMALCSELRLLLERADSKVRTHMTPVP